MLRPPWLWCLVALAFIFEPLRAGADDRLLLRGNYYREASTRVIQPIVDISADAPDERFTVGAGYMLDAITSASIGQGTAAVTGDNTDPQPFTEFRHEASLRMGSRLGRWAFGGFFRYSTETDYVARNVGASASVDLFERSGTLSLSYAYGFDRVFEIISAFGDRQPWCGGILEGRCESKRFPRSNGNLLQTHYLALGYSHALHRTLLGHLTFEGVDARGPQDNPYRDGFIRNGFEESHPLVRQRLAITGGARWAIPRAKMVVDPRYRFYADDWGIRSHAADLRLHFRVVRHLRLRVRYRYYAQSASDFYREDGIYTGDPGELRTGDVKMERFRSHTPGLQVTYELDGLARFRGFEWLAGSWIQATYNQVVYVFDHDNNRYCKDNGDTICLARLGSLAYGMSF